MTDSSLRRWVILGVVAATVIVVALPLYVLRERQARSKRALISTQAIFVGRESCIDCHEAAYRAWLGSDHDRAMDVASDSTVLADFNDTHFENDDIAAHFFRRGGKYYVRTQGPDGADTDFEITHTFGVEPLQQYLVPFPGGRMQALSVAWDVVEERWFYLYPEQSVPRDDWLHWTRGGQNWNGMCAECHSTNLQKNFDPKTRTYATTWSEIDVSCEACHGPGSEHVAWAKLPPMARPQTKNYALVVRTSNLSSRDQVGLCAPCHSRRSELGDYDHRSVELLENHLPTTLRADLYHADGQILDEVYVYGSFLQSKMYRNNVRCSDCHDAHSLRLRAEGNALCAQCHRPDVYDSYDHHFHKREHEGKPSEGYLCVACHMPEQPYMVVDWRADHSMRVPRPDLSLELGTPNACSQAGCHADKPLEWAVEHYRTWYGIAKKPHYGTILSAGREGAPDADTMLASMSADTLYPAIVRATALSLLGNYGDAGRLAFDHALADPDALVRHTAVEHVTSAGADDLVERVAPLLFDPVRAVRMQAAVRLAGVPAGDFKPYQLAARDTALVDYESAMMHSLDFAASAHNMGNLHANVGDTQGAIRYYERALEIDDLFYPAKVNLAMLYNSMGRNAQAESLLRDVVASWPEQHDAAYSLGLLLVEMKNFEDALPFLGQAARGMPGDARVQYNYGLLLQQMVRLDDAQSALEAALAIDPENFDFLFALADHHFRRGNANAALYYAEMMTRLYPDNKLGHDVTAAIRARLGAGQR